MVASINWITTKISTTITDSAKSLGEAARAATTQDLDELVGLCGHFHEQLQSARGGRHMANDYAIHAIDHAFLASAMKDKDSHVVVGTFDGVPVGLGIVAAGGWDAASSATRGEVRIFFVDESARRVGVGEAIFREITAWCSAMQLREIDVSTLPGDQETKSFLETEGYRARMLIMHRELEQ